VSLERRPRQAVGFYSVIGIAIATGLSLNFLHVDPVKALYWSAILNGLVAAPLMAVIMLMASNRKVMGKFVIPAYLRWVGWCASTVMFCVCFGVVFSWRT
jgi:Mn2+/Fe2+ NRAMP family transporter